MVAKLTDREAAARVKAVHGRKIKPSSPYVSGGAHLTFTCSKGHTWKASLENVTHKSNPTGCPHCNHPSKAKTEKEYAKEFSRLNPGYTLLTPYKNATTKVMVECRKGHKSLSWPRYVGCSLCKAATLSTLHRTPPENYRKQLRDTHPTIRWVGGVRENRQSVLSFTCTSGHTFESNCSNILKREYACPSCPKPTNKRWHSSPNSYSKVSIECIDAVSRASRLVFNTAKRGGEYRVPNTRYRVDGHNPTYGIVIEFHGDYFHGALDKRTKRYVKTIKRDNELRTNPSIGLYLVVWEGEWLSNPKGVLTRIKNSIAKHRAKRPRRSNRSQ